MHKVSLLEISGLLASVALIGSVTAIAQEVPLLSLLIFAVALITGLILDKKSAQSPVLSPLVIISLVILGIVISLVGIKTENFFSRVLSILLIIISAKLISPKKSRDMLQIYLLNLLVLSAAAVVRWGLEFGLLVIVEAFISVTGLIFIYGSNEQQEVSITQVWHLVRWSSLMALCLVPTTVFFFLILPRPAGILFGWGGGALPKSGFSDRVTLGAVEQIKIDRSPAFRVKWLRGRPPQRPLWRGIVYDTYSQGTWEKRYKRKVDFPKIRAETVQYEILLEPTNSRYLLSLGLPVKILLKKAILVSGYTIKVRQDIPRRTLYRVESYSLPDIPADLLPSFYLGLRKEVKQQLVALAKPLVGETVLETVKAVESFLKTKFTYNLSPGKAHGDPVLYFLFTGKKGHCEYFASAMTLLLRTLGIPARIVGGYLGGDWNELGQYYLVRQSDAHAWVEAWIEDRGWVTFDPTPETSVENPLFRVKIFRLIDLFKVKWYYWVLGYDTRRQMDLARKTASLFHSIRSSDNKINFTLKAPNFKKLIPFLLIVGFILSLKIAWPYLHGRPRTWGERFVHVFQRHGYCKKSGETLQEFADRIAKDNSLLGQKALEFVKHYYLLEYGQNGKEETLNQLLKDMENELKKGDPHYGKNNITLSERRISG